MNAETPALLFVTAAELAKLAGVHPQQLARFIKQGFLACDAFTPSGITLFQPALVQRVKFIATHPSLRGLFRTTTKQHENHAHHHTDC